MLLLLEEALTCTSSPWYVHFLISFCLYSLHAPGEQCLLWTRIHSAQLVSNVACEIMWTTTEMFELLVNHSAYLLSDVISSTPSPRPHRNYNYIRASVALTGAPQTFCQRPDLIATKEEYAWGAGLFYWVRPMLSWMIRRVCCSDSGGRSDT